MGRDFSSPPGGLYFSLLLRTNASPEHLPLLTLAAGVMSCRVIEKASGFDVMLKWPNDLYLRNKKLGGILCESAPYAVDNGNIPFMVIGIGLNINTRPDRIPHALRESVISLYSLQKKKYDLDRIMMQIAGGIINYADKSEHMLNMILAEWRQRDYLFGRHIYWQGAGGREFDGTGAGLLPDGRYGLRTADGDILPILGGELNILQNSRRHS